LPRYAAPGDPGVLSQQKVGTAGHNAKHASDVAGMKRLILRRNLIHFCFKHLEFPWSSECERVNFAPILREPESFRFHVGRIRT
jgi:hypothetical protein